MINVSKLRFRQLYVPILIEQLFMMLMTQIDVLMLSAYDTKAIAVSGINTQLMMLLTFIITVIHVGVSIRLVHQKAYEVSELKSEIYHSLTLNFVFSILISLIAHFTYHKMLIFMHVPQEIFEITYQFGVVFLWGFGITTTQMLVSSLLRILNLAHIAAQTTIGMNIINIVLNYLVLFVFVDYFGQPILAVAIATLITRMLGIFYAGYHLIKMYRPQLKNFKLNRFKSKKVLSLGLPGAGEQISYHFAQTIMVAFLAIIGTEVVASKTLAVAMSNVSFCVAMAYSMASQIYLGKLMARKKFTVLTKSVHRGLVINATRSVVIMTTLVGVFYMLGRYFIDETVFHFTVLYLCCFILLEPIRAVNNYIVDLLNITGDVRYPVCINIITTWCLLIPISYFVSMRLGWGYTGMIFTNIFEESIRFFLMLRRWHKGRWKLKLSKIGVGAHV